MEIRISVRNLVEFILRSGDLDNRIPAPSEKVMQEGSAMHRRLQKEAGGDYHAEVPLSTGWPIGEDLLIVEGRADGIFEGEIPAEDVSVTVLPDEESGLAFAPGSAVTIDEIKTTYRRLSLIRHPQPVHLAQARCYAYMYAKQNGQENMHIRMTYCNLLSGKIRYFYENISFHRLEEWFTGVMKEYEKWASFLTAWREIRQSSLRKMCFPYSYREGQRELAAGVYQTILQGKKLFLEAPTGTGKTLAVLYPALKAMGADEAERIFYLTAKNAARSVAQNTMTLLAGQGLRCKTCTLTAKEKMCALERPECNPEACPRARGHFDRINDAIYDLLCSEDSFTMESTAACADKYQVCPFELSLDMSLFSDVILCDYNYVFDPHAYLRRFFAEGQKETANLFLIDEAHNLVDRGRDMYSAALYREEILAVKRQVKGHYPELEKKLLSCCREASKLRKDLLQLIELAGEDRAAAQRQGYLSAGGQNAMELSGISRFADRISAACDELKGILERYRIRSAGGHRVTKTQKELHESLLEFYFRISHFQLICEKADRHYRCFARLTEKEELEIVLLCVDPSANLKECMDRGKAAVLFSATFLPIQYYKSLLGGTPEDYEIYARSVFDPEKQGIFILSDVTSRFRQRGPEQYRRIADEIREITRQRHGNYMVFFPSYHFLQQTAESFKLGSGDREEVRLLCQKEKMSEEEREEFLKAFERISDERTQIGFCILGGIFSEGIDLKNDSLIGALIVGTGIPGVCTEREICREYFDEDEAVGYDYAYRFPGMNKVLQAAGRVIRTSEDVGIVGLLDERFLENSSRRLFPAEWGIPEETTLRTIGRRVERFWNEWL